VNPFDTNRENILEVTAFADPDRNGEKKFSVGSLNLRILNPDAPVSANIDSVILTSDVGTGDGTASRTFAGGRAKVLPIYVHVGLLNLRHTKKLHLIGPEIALAALLISAGVARVRCAERAAERSGQLTITQDHLVAADEMVLQDMDPDAQSQVRKYEPRIRPTWLVRPDEDLCRLAGHLFHDAHLGWLIADLNQSSTKELCDGQKRIIELQVRQKIELPVWQDIIEFRKMRVEFSKQDLITIVTDTAIDRELMQLTLAPVIGVAAPATGGLGSTVPATAVPATPVPATVAAFVPASVAAALPVSIAAAVPVSGAPALPSVASSPASFSASTPVVASRRVAEAVARGRSVALPVLALTKAGREIAARHTKQDPTAVATVTDLAPVAMLNTKYA
jgi:hypothetical protein